MKSHSYQVLTILRHLHVHLRLHLCLAAVLCLSACQKKPVDVPGQVFIVTPDGINEKMALIGIHALGDDEFKTFAASVLDRLLESGKRVARKEADTRAYDAAEKYCGVLARQDYVIPGLHGVLEEVRARRQLLGSPGSHPAFDDLLDKVVAALPAEVTQTDADGRFSIPINRSVWVIAVSRRKSGGRGEGRLWVVPCRAWEADKARPLLLSNYGLVTGIRAFAAIADLEWEQPERNKISLTPGVANWIIATFARADEMAADAKLRNAMTVMFGPGDWMPDMPRP